MILLIGVALAVYVSLATLQPGAPVKIGLPVSLAVLTMAWFGTDAQSMERVLVMFAGGAVALAALVQGLRGLLPEKRAGWAYPVMVVLAPLGLALPLILFGR
jgi:hypothetical protein